jgi:uncharacterized protein DUF1905
MRRPTVEFNFEDKIWHYQNPNTVYFASLPEVISAEVIALIGTSHNPWGTVPVDATIDDVTWYTSMFPRQNGRYCDLPIKSKNLSNLGLIDGHQVAVTISIQLPW